MRIVSVMEAAVCEASTSRGNRLQYPETDDTLRTCEGQAQGSQWLLSRGRTQGKAGPCEMTD